MKVDGLPQGTQWPALTPVTRSNDEKGVRRVVIPRTELERQIAQQDRLATWFLAQAIAEMRLILSDPNEDNRARNATIQRYLSWGAAVGGAINSRITAYKFLTEGDGSERTGGRPDLYHHSGPAARAWGPQR